MAAIAKRDYAERVRIVVTLIVMVDRCLPAAIDALAIPRCR